MQGNDGTKPSPSSLKTYVYIYMYIYLLKRDHQEKKVPNIVFIELIKQ